MVFKLADGSRLVHNKNTGQISRYGPDGKLIEKLRPADSGYSYWHAIVYGYE